MKRIVAVVVLLLFVAAPVIAADTVTLKSKMGDVTFNHKVHGEKAGCKACHPTEPATKFSLGGKDPAHKLCAGCHTEKKAGPQANKCMDCHKKK
ncbi:MAG TPA: cytochrome c3 family protein [Nitrospirota bacterium]|nr:cytochrome c3 family protein [Nitrospirota bacterium]